MYSDPINLRQPTIASPLFKNNDIFYLPQHYNNPRLNYGRKETFLPGLSLPLQPNSPNYRHLNESGRKNTFYPISEENKTVGYMNERYPQAPYENGFQIHPNRDHNITPRIPEKKLSILPRSGTLILSPTLISNSPSRGSVGFMSPLNQNRPLVHALSLRKNVHQFHKSPFDNVGTSLPSINQGLVVASPRGQQMPSITEEGDVFSGGFPGTEILDNKLYEQERKSPPRRTVVSVNEIKDEINLQSNRQKSSPYKHQGSQRLTIQSRHINMTPSGIEPNTFKRKVNKLLTVQLGATSLPELPNFNNHVDSIIQEDSPEIKSPGVRFGVEKTFGTKLLKKLNSRNQDSIKDFKPNAKINKLETPAQDKEFDKFDHLLGDSFQQQDIESIEEFDYEESDGDEKEEIKVLKGLAEGIKEPHLKGKSKVSKNIKLKNFLWTLVYPSLVSSAVQKKVEARRNLSEKAGLKRIKEQKDIVTQFIMRHCTSSLEKIYNEEKAFSIIIEDNEKKVSSSEISRRFTLITSNLCQVLEDLNNALESETLGKSLQSFFADLCHERSILPNKFLTEFEVARLNFSHLGTLKNLTPNRAKMIIGSFVLLKVLVFTFLAKPWTIFPDLKKTPFLTRNLKSVGSILYQAVMDIFKTDLSPIKNNQTFITPAKRLQARKVPLIVFGDDNEINNYQALSDEVLQNEIIIGLYLKEKLKVVWTKHIDEVNKLSRLVERVLANIYSEVYEV